MAKKILAVLSLLVLTACSSAVADPSAAPQRLPSGFCIKHPNHPKCQSPSPSPPVSSPPVSSPPVSSPPVSSPPVSTPPVSTPPVSTPPVSSPPPGTWSCQPPVGYGATCGAYSYSGIVNSNGFNTYVGVDCWANPQCTSRLQANSPGDWQVTTREPAGNTGVRSYPDVQQLMNNWDTTGGGWANCGSTCGDTPISGLASLSASYTETFPHNAGTIAQFAWDIWTNNNSGHPGEIMVWVDNVNRGNGGATQRGTATINGQAWTIYTYGSGELIWSLGAPGSYAQQSSGTVDLLAILKESIRQGFTSPNATLGQVNAGWEVCSTGGVDETFRVSRYTLTGAAL